VAENRPTVPFVMTQRSSVSAKPFIRIRERCSGSATSFWSPEMEMTRRGGGICIPSIIIVTMCAATSLYLCDRTNPNDKKLQVRVQYAQSSSGKVARAQGSREKQQNRRRMTCWKTRSLTVMSSRFERSVWD